MTGTGSGASPGRRMGRPRVEASTIPGPPREAILSVASRLFAERGFVNTTLTEIGRRAGLRTSSLYYYFDGKEAMLHAIVNEVNRVSLDRLAAINADGGKVSVRLFRLIRFDVSSLCTLPYDVNEIQRLAVLQEERFSSYWKERQQLHDEVEDLVQHGIDSGEFVARDARLVALTILANNEGVQNWFRPLGDYRIVTRTDLQLSDLTPDVIGDHLGRIAVGDLIRDKRALRGIEREACRLDGLADRGGSADGPYGSES